MLLVLLVVAFYAARIPATAGETAYMPVTAVALAAPVAPTPEPTVELTAEQTASPTTTPLPTSTARAPTATSTATPTPLPEPRIFIASERANAIQVWQGEPPRLITSIRAGNFPHNISVSNDARWVAVANRHSNDISIIDAAALTEITRVRVGKAPHDMAWSPDNRRLYVTQENEFFITVIDTATWRLADSIPLDTPQHDLALSPDGTELWVTTIRYRGLLVINRATGDVIERLAYFPHGSHDITFRPDAGEVWVTSSGFIRDASQIDPYIVIFDRATRKIKANQPFGVYPFHSVKLFRDGLYLPSNADTLWYSDRGLGGVILVSVPRREVVAEIKTGAAPFHLSFGPNGLLYVANHDDATLSVIDPRQRVLLHSERVAPDPHGIVVVAAP
ncbi:MAG: beta-propeller fold lactonase family protein [Chloroflexi bacterium]|nr:beta-propeller fold lactonase family protein [Chloroflexota bacterium]